MKLYRVEGRGWAVDTGDGLFELRSSWLDLSGREPELGPKIPRHDALRLLAPVEPTKIVCVGLNFAKHAEEQGKPVPDEPVIFTKPLTALNDPDAAIRLPALSQEVHHEGELAIVVGKRLTRANEAEAEAAIYGYTCANDVTARDIQRREKRYTRAKGFDTFCPVGPAVILARDFDPAEHVLELRVNGIVRQHSRLDDFIFGLGWVLSYISQVMTLLPGDLVLTGTPAGVGPIVAGDRVEVEIDGIGVLVSNVL